ncbi:hypothetical protein EOD23_35490 [Mesorhizobium sp. USDA-HM6]|nr:hypothetical protein EOD23_35490 [Mesorhizobium sp. USDA-HM6]
MKNGIPACPTRRQCRSLIEHGRVTLRVKNLPENPRPGSSGEFQR